MSNKGWTASKGSQNLCMYIYIYIYIYACLRSQSHCCNIYGCSTGKFNVITTRVPAIRTVTTYLRSASGAVVFLVFKVAVL
jgi:hypothetical protein